jgi:hypothetical protein
MDTSRNGAGEGRSGGVANPKAVASKLCVWEILKAI